MADRDINYGQRNDGGRGGNQGRGGWPDNGDRRRENDGDRGNWNRGSNNNNGDRGSYGGYAPKTNQREASPSR